MRLENKVAIITGASNGIGREIALGFAREGANVAVGYAGGKERAEAVAAQIREMGRQATVFQMDIAKPEDAQRVVDETMAAFGRIDILVNNAGSRDPAPVDECTPEVYHHAVDSNLRGLFAAVKAVTSIMIKEGGGKIINVSSLLGLRNCNAGRIGYCSTKRGIEAMTRAMAAELGPHHIYVNSIAPGTIETNMGGLGALFTDEVIKERSKFIPLRFRGEPEMLVGPALFLASSDSDYVTGTCVIVDGGWCAVD